MTANSTCGFIEFDSNRYERCFWTSIYIRHTFKKYNFNSLIRLALEFDMDDIYDQLDFVENSVQIRLLLDEIYK